MIDKIFIFDDIIPESYQDDIENRMLGETMLPWYIVDDISYSKSELGMMKQSNALVHNLKADNQINSPVFNFLLPLVHLSLARAGVTYHDTIVSKSFLQFPSKVSADNNIHTDLPSPHIVCLYYVNDSDGDTVIYNQTNETIRQQDIPTTNFVEQQRISPRKGRVVVFNGKYYHNSSNPAGTRRCVINFDVI